MTCEVLPGAQTTFRWVMSSSLQGSEVENPDVAMTRKPDDAQPFSGLAFKIMADPFVGTLTFVRIYRCNICAWK